MTINSLMSPRGLIIPLMIFTNGMAQANTNYPPHSGESPVSYEHVAEPGGEFIVTDRKSGVLDLYMYRDSRPFEITVTIPVHRYIGDVSTALANGVVSETARIYIPSYDVDSEAKPVADCDGDGIIDDALQAERDDVYFNGEKIGELKGQNDLWKFNAAFDVPIEKVNFPSAPGQVAINTIQIAIDIDNKDVLLSGGGIGCKAYATSIDWVGLKFETAKPIYLLPGLSGNSETLDNSGYTTNLMSTLGLQSKVLEHSAPSFALSCNPKELEGISSFADEIISHIRADGTLTGTAQSHLVAHSMGGLDARVLLQKLADKDYLVKVSEMDGAPVFENMDIKSLLTHSTPHKGTLVADFLPSILPATGFIQDLCEIKVETWKISNTHFDELNEAKFASIGTDADTDQSGYLSPEELAGNQIPSWSGLANIFHTLLYTRDELTIEYEPVLAPGGVTYTPKVQYSGNGPNPNDSIVTVESAHGAPGITSKETLTGGNGKNHGTILDTQSQNVAISQGTAVLGWGELK